MKTTDTHLLTAMPPAMQAPGRTRRRSAPHTPNLEASPITRVPTHEDNGIAALKHFASFPEVLVNYKMNATHMASA